MSNIQQGNSLFGRGLPQHLEKPGAFRVEHGYKLAEGRDWHDALLPEFWHGCAKYLDAGHRIEVHSCDSQVQFNVIVLSCNSVAQPPILDLGFTPIFPPDLQLPVASGSRRHRAQFDQSHNYWVVRDPAGEIVARELSDRDAALKVCAQLDQAAVEAPRIVKDTADPAAAPNDRPPYRVLPSAGGGYHVVAVDSGDVVTKKNMPLREAESDCAARNAAVRRVPASAPAAPATDDAAARAAELAALGKAPRSRDAQVAVAGE